MTVRTRDECEKCGADVDSLARPGECADERCKGRMVLVEYVPAKHLQAAVDLLRRYQQLREEGRSPDDFAWAQFDCAVIEALDQSGGQS